MIDEAGLWAGTGIMCAVLFLLIVFAIYKQHFGTLTMPPRKPEPKPDDKTEEGQDAGADENSANPPPPYPNGDGPAAYDQPVDDGVEVSVEVHGTDASCAGKDPEESAPYVYAQNIQLETST